MDTEKLLKVVELTRKVKQQQDEAQVTLHKMIFAVARQHLKDNGVKQTMHDWAQTADAIKMMLGIKQSVTAYHRHTRSMRPTHMRSFDLKPVRVLSPGHLSTLYNVYEMGNRRTFRVICEAELDADYISIEVKED